ncbi:MAG: hypothetical protein CTY34_03035 [Methylobacter sp.]|nr:MAG: hypothetical protein CTY34_03035 [Methylobacter sp.]PPD05519.1 MAG: hypothetical protein CTY29_00790 [Methylobacter sp.]PPD24554.1 MAG: hypothetical protein CTY24_00385 [Methylobacter sp.]PPD32127.1 MAG: hypothetical protein CTY18_11115 [Methylomonas sp.]
MVKKTQKPSSNSTSELAGAEPETEKVKNEVEIDEDFEMSDDFINFPTESEKAAKKMAARRKIEMYWEKKRLQEQLGDLDDLDLDF